MTRYSRYRRFVGTEAPQTAIPSEEAERRFTLPSRPRNGTTFHAVIPTGAEGGAEGSMEQS